MHCELGTAGIATRKSCYNRECYDIFQHKAMFFYNKAFGLCVFSAMAASKLALR